MEQMQVESASSIQSADIFSSVVDSQLIQTDDVLRFHWIQHLNRRVFLNYLNSLSFRSAEEREVFLKTHQYLYNCFICMPTKN